MDQTLTLTTPVAATESPIYSLSLRTSYFSFSFATRPATAASRPHGCRWSPLPRGRQAEITPKVGFGGCKSPAPHYSGASQSPSTITTQNTCLRRVSALLETGSDALPPAHATPGIHCRCSDEERGPLTSSFLITFWTIPLYLVLCLYSELAAMFSLGVMGFCRVLG